MSLKQLLRVGRNHIGMAKVEELGLFHQCTKSQGTLEIAIMLCSHTVSMSHLSFADKLPGGLSSRIILGTEQSQHDAI
jgi:hypothetical protein